MFEWELAWHGPLTYPIIIITCPAALILLTKNNSLDKVLKCQVQLEERGADGQGVVDVVVARVLDEDDRLQLVARRLDDLARHLRQLEQESAQGSVGEPNKRKYLVSISPSCSLEWALAVF